MFEKLPSLRGFQPKFYAGGPLARHLPFLYDCVARTRPKLSVTLGFGEGEGHFAFCQALQAEEIDGRAIAFARAESEAAEQSWLDGREFGAKNFGGRCELRDGAIDSLADGTIELLLIDDCDSGVQLRAELSALSTKLAPNALVVFHGVNLERADAPAAAWREWIDARTSFELPGGLGLSAAQRDSVFLRELQANPEATQLYHLAGRYVVAGAKAAKSSGHLASLGLQKAWLTTLLSIGAEAQKIIDHQVNVIAELESWRKDREKAQNVIEHQKMVITHLQRKIRHLAREGETGELLFDAANEEDLIGTIDKLRRERDDLKKRWQEQKRIINATKEICRKKGNCVREAITPRQKQARSINERIRRELLRWPRNVRDLIVPPKPVPVEEKEDDLATRTAKHASKSIQDRYAEWIERREPDAAGLEEQRRIAATWTNAPRISFLMPTLNTPPEMLEELLASLAAQTSGSWELCVAEAGSENPATIEVLKKWETREARIRIDWLGANLGIAENTNRAFSLASGEFIACIDHDDLLAPFAVYDLVRAILAQPDGEIFYSDEDRLSAEGKRHSPYFKPEWSPALLTSSMYLGHITVYRRALAEELGGWRKEFDLSQDYDFALRATDQPRVIVHVPRVLYHWREHAGSAAAGAKPQARLTNLAALEDAMRRRNLPAEIIRYPHANRARLKLSRMPKVSIIIPTDSAARGVHAVEKMPATISYPDFEIVIVTNSALAEVLKESAGESAPVRFVAYDLPFNFSDKCNAGAKAASGERLIFYNDDVETEQREWIQNLIEPLEDPTIGAVAPKLLYAYDRIQHAGLVTGVRGLVGTAFHEQPADTLMHSGLAQMMREVSALSAACLAMRRDDFFRVGEFDPINTPIAHSDLDLCFKVRAAGLRCVYTPFATLTHRGHVSIGAVEEAATEKLRETASVYLLRRWPEYTCHDPYFPENMRDWLYADSPTPIQMWAKDSAMENDKGRALLFAAHDLSWSGAPLILLDIARWCRERGYFVLVMSPKDGPVREKLVEAGIPVIADSLMNKKHPSFAQLAREFDCVIASTMFGGPIVRAAKTAGVPHFWWIHEGRVAEHYLREDAQMRRALNLADLVVTPDSASAEIYQPYCDRKIRVLPYGIPDPGKERASIAEQKTGPINFLLLGTIEERKGQRVLLQALRKLPAEILSAARFELVGLAHDAAIVAEIEAVAKENRSLIYRGSVSHAEALARVRATDVMLSCSWDETGPLVLMEALAVGKPIVCTMVGAVGEKLSVEEDGGLFFEPGDAAALAAAITRLVQDEALRNRLTSNARQLYEKHFTFTRFAEGFEVLLDETLAAAGSIAGS